MRRIATIGCVLVACAMARAEDIADRTGADALPAPTAADVISQLYQFDLFQQNAVDRADSAVPSDISTIATARAEAALKRDKALDELRQQTGTEIPSAPKTAAMRAHSLAAVDRSDGPTYVRAFFAAQLAEYELTVGLLEHYLQRPDSEDVRSFAAAQLPVLRTELADTRNALTDK
jgi:hypothetical protein